MRTPIHCLSLAVAIGLAAATSSRAEILLFEDEFEVSDKAALSEPEGRQQINREAAKRQTGSLAPTEYSSNGQPWQLQLFGGGVVYGGALRIFPTNDKNLLLSPSWNLDESAGDYSLGLRINTQLAKEEMPAMVFVALGTASGPLLEGMSNNLDGALVLKISLLPEPTMVLMKDGVEISDAVPFSSTANWGDIVVRWTQKAPREIAGVEVMSYGGTVLKHEENVSVAGSGFMLGGRMASDQITANDFGCLMIDLLRYVRE